MRKSRSRRRPPEALAISETELLGLTADLDEMHHASLPAMHGAVEQWIEEVRGEAARLGRARTSRRRFLMGGGLAVSGVVLAACGSDGATSGTSTPSGPPGTDSRLTGDFAIAALAASLENLAVNTYQAALDAVTAGKLGAVPPAVATFATTAKSQHADHSAAWNSVLTNGAKRPVAGVDQTVRNDIVDPGFAQVTDVGGLARFALGLESTAAATYLAGIGMIQNNNALKVAASIQPVEMQHVAILNFVLGQYPVPDAFATTDGARSTSDTIS